MDTHARTHTPMVGPALAKFDSQRDQLRVAILCLDSKMFALLLQLFVLRERRDILPTRPLFSCTLNRVDQLFDCGINRLCCQSSRCLFNMFCPLLTAEFTPSLAPCLCIFFSGDDSGLPMADAAGVVCWWLLLGEAFAMAGLHTVLALLTGDAAGLAGFGCGCFALGLALAATLGAQEDNIPSTLSDTKSIGSPGFAIFSSLSLSPSSTSIAEGSGDTCDGSARCLPWAAVTSAILPREPTTKALNRSCCCPARAVNAPSSNISVNVIPCS